MTLINLGDFVFSLLQKSVADLIRPKLNKGYLIWGLVLVNDFL